jgi:transcriptional regulator with XRE-family HTH domain
MLASTVGISNPHMSNIERGKTKVSLATLIDIANALDTTFDALICDNLVKGKVVFD